MMGIDRTILPVIVGPLVSLLLLNGVVTDACVNEVNAAFTEVLIVVLTLGSLAISALHHKEIKKIEAVTSENEELTRRNRLNALAVVIKSLWDKFAYKKPPTTPEKPQQDPL